WSGWRIVCAVPAASELLHATLGDQFGLVRILFFDKPPGQSWNLGVHRDKTIAVAEHHDPADPYGKPTVKAGVPHVVADDTLLEQMVTLRLHLDAMHADNGPLVVVPGSHHDRENSDRAATVEIHCDAGDVFVMRPLLLHGSRSTSAGCSDHRRVVHLEFAPAGAIATPYQWYQYQSL
ncbi:MAG: phytanoyl-CoA dioxygenase family protein, partial [Planctomycetales bacterium]|nr:phytanoyl-CoA dioxygenase family protein [Planctomycetales bacterium]